MALWMTTLILLIFPFMDLVSCYSRGAPKAACNTLLPHHGNAAPLPVMGKCFFSLSRHRFKRTDKIKVQMVCRVPILKGFMIQARNEKNIPVGTITFDNNQFIQYAEGCQGNPKATITHTPLFHRRHMHFFWQLGTDMGNSVHFRGTAVEAFSVIYKDIKSQPLVLERIPCLPPPPQLPNTKQYIVTEGVVNYTCVAGFTRSAPIQVRCIAGKWHHSPGVCTAVASTALTTTTQSMEASPNVTVSVSVSTTSTTSPSFINVTASPGVKKTNATRSQNFGNANSPSTAVVMVALFVTTNIQMNIGNN